MVENELTQDRIEFLAKDYCRGFVEFCGFQAAKIDQGLFESTLTIGENHKTQDNFIHAGVIATMSDHTAGYAAYTLVAADIRILTIEFKINFFKPAYGHTLKCKSEILSRGKQIIVAQSTVFDVRDTDEKMVSKSTITLMAIPTGKLKRKGDYN